LSRYCISNRHSHLSLELSLPFQSECHILKEKRLKVYTPEDKLLPAKEIDADAREAIALKVRSATIFGEPVFFDEKAASANETETGIAGLKWKRGLINTVNKKPVEDKQDQASEGAGGGQTVVEKGAGKDAATSREEVREVPQTREPGATGVYWDGPESKLGMLDLLVWKPLIVCA
jgi:hypothetical protein